MPFHPDLHHRRSVRLPGYDYSSFGAYYVTLVTHERELLFGEILDGAMRASPAGKICAEEWLRSAELRSEITLDAWIVMPNHVHGVVLIGERAGVAPGRCNETAARSGPRPRSLSAFVAGFKSAVTKSVNELRETPGAAVWERNYFEHIIRDGAALHAIREYIQSNPARWADDQENPSVAARLRP